MGSEINQEDKENMRRYSIMGALTLYLDFINLFLMFTAYFEAIVVNHKLRRFNNRIVKSHNLFSYGIFVFIKYGQQVVIYSVRCLFLSIKRYRFYTIFLRKR